MPPDFALEEEARAAGHVRVCGIDEAGRGPWAGPVVAAAVILDPKGIPKELLRLIDDSKRVTATRREEIFAALMNSDWARVGIGRANVAEIDEFNILGASLLAMRRAVAALVEMKSVPDFALIDGDRLPALPCRSRAVVRGDGLSVSIAAASIAAKVTRDEIMRAIGHAHPGYGFENHMGYGTPEHREALTRLGPCVHHRRSFQPVREITESTTSGMAAVAQTQNVARPRRRR